MADLSLIPLDDYVGDDWYPGYEPRRGWQHYMDMMRPFTKADEGELWFHESLHWSRGVVPGGIDLLEDVVVWGTQLGALLLPLPPGNGIKGRFAGTHVYGGQISVGSEWEMQVRGARFGRQLGPYLQNFKDIWGSYEKELKDDFDYFVGLDVAALDYDGLRQALSAAHAYHQRSMFIHFEVMYSLLGNYLAFYELNKELGLDPARAAVYLTGDKTKFMEADEELWKLARRSRELKVDGTVLAGDVTLVPGELQKSTNGRLWWTDLQRFLNVYGYRIDEVACIELAPWIDRPIPPLNNIRTLLGQPADHDFGAKHRQMIEGRDQAIEEARRHVGGGNKLQQFNAGLASCQQANFSWWNDEHNFHIDQRSHIPAHWVTQALGRRLAADGHLKEPEDVYFLFTPELFEGLAGDADTWKRLRGWVPARRDYYNHWLLKAPDMPHLLGTIPESIDDPIMLEIFGLYPHFLEAVRRGASSSNELHGLAASGGVVEGVARVLTSISQISELQAGEILVCNYTTPDWTPVFGVIKACVCDGGGSLTHAAIVSREYGIPCVVGTAAATHKISTGDRVRVDGDHGLVTVFK